MHIIDEKQSTLEKTSCDEHDKNTEKKYMVHSQLTVCDFDKVKDWYISNKIPFVRPTPKSNDALYFGEQECYFIEFKNGTIDGKLNFEINKKIYDSLFILFDLQYTDKNGELVNSISYTRKNMNYILVYNEEKYSEDRETMQTKEGKKRQKERRQEGASKSGHRDKLYKAIGRLAKDDFILFGLDQFENYFFKNVYTYTEKEFEQNFVNKIQGFSK